MVFTKHQLYWSEVLSACCETIEKNTIVIIIHTTYSDGFKCSWLKNLWSPLSATLAGYQKPSTHHTMQTDICWCHISDRHKSVFGVIIFDVGWTQTFVGNNSWTFFQLFSSCSQNLIPMKHITNRRISSRIKIWYLEAASANLHRQHPFCPVRMCVCVLSMSWFNTASDRQWQQHPNQSN